MVHSNFSSRKFGLCAETYFHAEFKVFKVLEMDILNPFAIGGMFIITPFSLRFFFSAILVRTLTICFRPGVLLFSIFTKRFHFTKCLFVSFVSGYRETDRGHSFQEPAEFPVDGFFTRQTNVNSVKKKLVESSFVKSFSVYLLSLSIFSIDDLLNSFVLLA